MTATRMKSRRTKALFLLTAHAFLLVTSFVLLPARRSFKTTSLHLASNQTALQRLTQSLHLIDVVQRTSQLDQFRRTSPDRATACCPFHDDSNPSFSMTPNMYKCFSCGASGNVLTFVQNYHQVSFGQAIKMLQNPELLPFVERKKNQQIKTQKQLQQHTSAERLRLAQLMAGAWFCQCLTQPMAGGARFYLLKQRPSFTARAIKQWGIGYAPDAYFSSVNTTSLTEHLRSLGFTAVELVEAGLAVPTKRAGQSRVLNFDTIIDRFRGRLMIPIMDATGKHILGFGGRSLASEDQPKYLNSPESVIFSKGSLLFGQHAAAAAAAAAAKMSATSVRAKPLLIVEGYMDVISLHAVGLGPAVATMGTAISTRQLEAALQLTQELVFCLDNDAAGVRAVERICQNGFLTTLQKEHPSARIAVATMPEGIKDPGEFVDERFFAKIKSADIANEFETNVIQSASEWRLWYTHRVIESCNCSSRADLRVTIDRVADFWSIAMTQEQRQEQAPRLAQQLAVRVSSNGTSEDMISVLREQIELNVLDQSSRMERINKATDVATSGRTLTQRMTLDGYEESNSLTVRDTSQLENGNQGVPTTERRRATMRARHQPPKQKTLTPHFAGFRFANQADRDWLGLSRKDPYNNYKLTLRPRVSKNYYRRGKDYLKNPEILQQQAVYFNSNRYHGNQFLTEEAALAGYSRQHSSSKEDIQSMATVGIGAVLKINKARVAVSTENTLLRTLVRSPAARSAIQQLLEARQAMQSTNDNENNPNNMIYWSSPERQWLFDVLVNHTNVPAHSTREYLLQLEQTPLGAFVNNSNLEEEGELVLANTQDQGILEPFFRVEGGTGLKSETLEQLTAQESFTNLLLLTAEQRLQEVADDPSALLQQVELVKTLTESSRRLSDRLFSESTKKREGSREEKYNALMAQIDEHVKTLPPLDDNPELQEELDRIDRDWSAWTESWAKGVEPEPATSTIVFDRLMEKEESSTSSETLEEALARIDRDWKYWIEKE